MSTLTAASFPGAPGVFPGYVRPGGYYATTLGAAWGSLPTEPFSGFVVDCLFSGDAGVGNQVSLAVQGNATSLNPLTMTVDGVAWISGATGTYDAPSNLTLFTGGNYTFVEPTAYTVLHAGAGPDVTPPTITSSASPSNTENTTLAHSLTANEAVTWAIRSVAQNAASVDASHFEISGSTLRWTGNGTKDYEAPTDTGSNNTYVVVVRATDTAGNTTDQTITVTVGNGFDGPTWVGVTAATGSTAATSITFASSGRASGDKLYIAIATANQAITTPTDFTEVPTVSPQSRGTAAAAGGLRLGLYERVSDGTEATVTIADSGDHQYAVGCVVRPASGQTIAIDVSAGKNAAASTSNSGNALTTTAAECLILEVWATDRDNAGPSYSGQANASLANLTERFDAGTTQGQGSGLVIYTGEKATAGSVSATTATVAASSAWCAITLALKCVSSAVPPLYRGPSAWSTFYKGTRTDAQNYKGAKTLHV